VINLLLFFAVSNFLIIFYKAKDPKGLYKSKSS